VKPIDATVALRPICVRWLVGVSYRCVYGKDSIPEKPRALFLKHFHPVHGSVFLSKDCIQVGVCLRPRVGEAAVLCVSKPTVHMWWDAACLYVLQAQSANLVSGVHFRLGFGSGGGLSPRSFTSHAQTLNPKPRHQDMRCVFLLVNSEAATA
jgi:hypothetical protein